MTPPKVKPIKDRLKAPWRRGDNTDPLSCWKDMIVEDAKGEHVMTVFKSDAMNYTAALLIPEMVDAIINFASWHRARFGYRDVKPETDEFLALYVLDKKLRGEK